MRYFLDQEFIERFKGLRLFKRSHVIELISIGLVAEDGRKYYAISKDFDPRKASDWVRRHVLHDLVYHCIYDNELFPDKKKRDKLLSTGRWPINEQVKLVQGLYGKTNKEITKEIFEFVNPGLGWHISAYSNSDFKDDKPMAHHFDKHNASVFKDKKTGMEYFYARPEFYGYFSDYDWVLFCSLFGTMMDQPPGFPMYCRDLKQTQDETAANIPIGMMDPIGRVSPTPSKNELADFRLEWLKQQADYPKPEREHNALSDAKFNFALYKYLQAFKIKQPVGFGL